MFPQDLQHMPRTENRVRIMLLFWTSTILYSIAMASYDSESSEGKPIVEFRPKCPTTINDTPVLQLTVDVPGTATAICLNGKKQFTSENGVVYTLNGTFEQTYKGPFCVFYKKTGGNTFFVNVEYGWGENKARLITKGKLVTVTCSYDAHGHALTAKINIHKSYLAANEHQTLVGEKSKVQVRLQIVDFKGNPEESGIIPMGKRIRLRAVQISHPGVGFQALSCLARNAVSSYPILRAGCGDGLVLPINEGFHTTGNIAVSPYFRGFRLVGPEVLTFHCTFSICDGYCDGNSCAMEERKKRSFNLNYSTSIDDREVSLSVTKTVRFLQLERKSHREVIPGYPERIPRVTIITVLSACVPVAVLCLVLSMYVCWTHRMRRRRGESAV